MMSATKSWRDNLADDKALPKVVVVDDAQSHQWRSAANAIPAPRKADTLACPQGSPIGCPNFSGAFALIAAHAATQTMAADRQRVPLQWWTLKDEGQLHPRFPRGTDAQRCRLISEAQEFLRRGRREFVVDWPPGRFTFPSKP
jgi:hypothetical protein